MINGVSPACSEICRFSLEDQQTLKNTYLPRAVATMDARAKSIIAASFRLPNNGHRVGLCLHASI